MKHYFYVHIGDSSGDRIVEDANKLTVDMGGLHYRALKIHSCCLETGTRIVIPVIRFPQLTANGSSVDFRGVVGSTLTDVVYDTTDTKWQYSTEDSSNPFYLVPSPIQRFEILLEDGNADAVALSTVDSLSLVLELDVP